MSEVHSELGTIVLNGQTWLVSKPTERDVFTVFSYAKKQAKKLYHPLKQVTDALAGLDVPIEAKTALYLQAGRVHSNGEVPEESISEYLTSAAGAAFYFWILARKNHPELKLEEAQQWITEENSIAVFAELDEASGVNMIHKSFEQTDFFQQP